MYGSFSNGTAISMAHLLRMSGAWHSSRLQHYKQVGGWGALQDSLDMCGQMESPEL